MKPYRPIVAVNTNGSVNAYFHSRTEAENNCGICHKDMGRALKNHYYTCKGFKWYYEDEYRDGWFEFGESHFAWTPSNTHKRLGSGFKKGHTIGNGRERWSEEAKKRHSEMVRTLCLKRKETDSYAKMGLKFRKPIRCLTDGMIFDSVKEAGKHYHIPPNSISSAIKRGGTTHKLKFEFI